MPNIPSILSQCSSRLGNSFLLLPAKTQRLRDRSQPKSAEQLVDTEAAQYPVDQSSEAETTEQLPHETQDTGKQETDGGDDLEQGLREETPERAETLLRVRHVSNALLRVVDCLDDRGGEFFEQLSQLMLFLGGFPGGSVGLGASSDASIRVEATDSTVALLQDTSTFFEQRLDLLDKFFFVQLILGCAVGLLDVLVKESAYACTEI